MSLYNAYLGKPKKGTMSNVPNAKGSMPERHANMLAMVVAQERPEIISNIAKTSKTFHPNYNPDIKRYYFLSVENSITYLNKFKNPFEEMRRLLCEDNIMLSPYVILYFFNNKKPIDHKALARYRPLQPHEKIPQFQTVFEFIRCIPNDYIYYNGNEKLNLFFHLFSRNTFGIATYHFTTSELITLSEELLTKGFTINYVLPTPDPTLKEYYPTTESPVFEIKPNMTAFSCGLLLVDNVDYLEWLVNNGANIRESDSKYLANFNCDSRDLTVYADKFRRVLTLFINNGIDINKQYYLNVYDRPEESLKNKQTILNYLMERNARYRTPTVDICIRILREHGAKTDRELGLVPVPQGGYRRYRRATRVKRSKRATRRRKV
jgi:hypothetical protein